MEDDAALASGIARILEGEGHAVDVMAKGEQAVLGARQEHFDMVILDVNPRVGATQGEQPVQILGQNFRQDIGYTVYFGTKKAGQVWTDEEKAAGAAVKPAASEAPAR